MRKLKLREAIGSTQLFSWLFTKLEVVITLATKFNFILTMS